MASHLMLILFSSSTLLFYLISKLYICRGVISTFTYLKQFLVLLVLVVIGGGEGGGYINFV